MFEFSGNRKRIIWDKATIYAYTWCANQRQVELVNVINKMPVHARQSILLYTFENMHRHDIAWKLNTSITNIRKYLLLADQFINEHASLSEQDCFEKMIVRKLFKNWSYNAYAELVSLRVNTEIVIRHPLTLKYTAKNTALSLN